MNKKPIYLFCPLCFQSKMSDVEIGDVVHLNCGCDITVYMEAEDGNLSIRPVYSMPQHRLSAFLRIKADRLQHIFE